MHNAPNFLYFPVMHHAFAKDVVYFDIMGHTLIPMSAQLTKKVPSNGNVLLCKWLQLGFFSMNQVELEGVVPPMRTYKRIKG